MPGRGEKEAGQRRERQVFWELLPLSQDSAGKQPSPPGGIATAQARGICSQCTHIHPCTVVDKTFTNSGRGKCGHLYCHVVKLAISGAISP